MSVVEIGHRSRLLLPERRENALEPVTYLRSIPYSEYRQSCWWRYRRESFAVGCRRCACCKEPRSDAFRFHVHHLSYNELGQEPDWHLALVCSRCHNLIHYPESAAAQHWLQQVGPSLLTDAEAMRP